MRSRPLRAALLLPAFLGLAGAACSETSLIGPVEPDSISRVPLAVAGGLTATDVAVGFHYACAATSSGVWCWGLFSHQVQGNGPQDDAPAPVALTGGASLTRVAASYRLACGLDPSGATSCWGDNGYGQLGVSDSSLYVSASARAVETGQRFIQVTAGSYQGCGLTAHGAVYCWGNGGTLGAGDGFGPRNPVPVRVASDRTFTQITAGQAHTCALDDTGAAWCWGKNADGQVGSGVFAGQSGAPYWVTTPQRVVGGQRFASLAAGGFHTCALTASGEAWCWGANFDGQLGNGTSGDRGVGSRAAPVSVTGGHTFSALFGGYYHTCALAADGAAWCWGGDYTGALGSRATQYCSAPSWALVDACSPQPLAVSGGLSFTRLAAGWGETCALTRAGKVYCWGLRRALGSGQ